MVITLALERNYFVSKDLQGTMPSANLLKILVGKKKILNLFAY